MGLSENKDSQIISLTALDLRDILIELLESSTQTEQQRQHFQDS